MFFLILLFFRKKKYFLGLTHFLNFWFKNGVFFLILLFFSKKKYFLGLTPFLTKRIYGELRKRLIRLVNLLIELSKHIFVFP
jgi:hypothetical protein